MEEVKILQGEKVQSGELMFKEVDTKTPGSVKLLEGTIPTVTAFHHVIAKGTSLRLDGNIGAYHVLFQVSGKATYETDGTSNTFGERVAFVPALDKELVIKGDEHTCILEMQIEMDETDMGFVKQYNVQFPLVKKYLEADQYRDSHKSVKTISRQVIVQRNIPRFALGSVEMRDKDAMVAHAHPPLDQYFFTLPENEMDLTLDGHHVPLKGNVLVHIPLGGNHGVECYDGQHCHYLWIDFMVNESVARRLDGGHRSTGTMRSLDK
jgi:quercetin dioxygenase-like cupin family protein